MKTVERVSAGRMKEIDHHSFSIAVLLYRLVWWIERKEKESLFGGTDE